MTRKSFTKTRGIWDTRRWVSIPKLQSEDQEGQIISSLESMAGVCQVLAYSEKSKIHVMYDQEITDFQSVLMMLENVGFPISNSWWSTKMAGWYQYLDKNARHNATSPVTQSSCCSTNNQPQERERDNRAR